MINKTFKKPLDSTVDNFIDFIKSHNKPFPELDINEIDFLTQRVAQNMFFYEDNFETAKSDYVNLLGLLLKKGVIFEKYPLSMELEVLYHGTKYKYTADKILKEGFQEYTYFTNDLNTAIGQGGKYVFEVVFFKNDLPDYWQVRCANCISAERIIRMCKYNEVQIIKNKKLQKKIFENALEFGEYKPYCFNESGKLKDFLKSL